MKLFIVEDDPIILELLQKESQNEGFAVSVVQDFSCLMDNFTEASPDLVLMDLILPVQNGYFWCQEIRKISNVPIMFISSRSEQMDMVMAMQFGADDFISKPLNLTLLFSKVRALLRRTYDYSLQQDVLEWKNLRLDLREAKLFYRSNAQAAFAGEASADSLHLTKTELTILATLFKGRGKIISREKILDACWQGEDFIDDNTLAVNMTRLRKKLEPWGCRNYIVTKKGWGYGLSK